MHQENCQCWKCQDNQLDCYRFQGRFKKQRILKAISYPESLQSITGYGYRYDQGPIISPSAIDEIPFQATGPLNHVEATQNGLSVQEGVYEIIAQVTIDYLDVVVSTFAIAVNGTPLETTTFIATSNTPTSGAVTVQSLNLNDMITLVALNTPTNLIVTTGNLTIKKLN